jgi:pyruvate/2-oxoglutarate dehydrogenase complex dihydrolipoamide dehydrogenase (E3) component
MGASVVLIERGKMGGDCLNYGCVPSKALIAAAEAAESARRAGRFGVDTGRIRIDPARVHDHVHGVIAAIAPNDSVARFEGLGVKIIQAEARFTGPREVVAGDTIVRARRFVVATGSSPMVPPIPGLDSTPYFTNETIFDNKAALGHLIVIGGGPIGIELAQAHRRLGAEVTVIEMARILPKDDAEPVDIVRRRLVGEGVTLREGVAVERVEPARKGVAVMVGSGAGGAARIEGSHLLIATGRRPNTGGLDLEAAGIAYSPKGIEVDRRLRSSNRRVYAMGDVAGAYQFTHVAGYHAGVVLKNVLFRLPARVNETAIPWVTYCRPELAGVGLSEAQARQRHGSISILRWPYAENDRAQAERETEGLIKIVASGKGRILGVTIVGARAGDLIQLWVLALGKGMKVGDIAQMITPYPNYGEVSKRAAGSHFTAKLFSEKTRKIVRLLAKFG